MQRLRVKYTKEEEIKYISHHDLMRVFERTIRRAEIPIAYSQGYNPHMLISYGPPLPLGCTSECEYLDLEIDGWTSISNIQTKLKQNLPPGIKILEITLQPPKDKASSIQEQTKSFSYSVIFNPEAKAQVEKQNAQILSAKDLYIEREGKNGKKKINLNEFLLELKIEGQTLIFTLKNTEKGTLKPSEIISLFTEISFSRLHRQKLGF